MIRPEELGMATCEILRSQFVDALPERIPSIPRAPNNFKCASGPPMTSIAAKLNLIIPVRSRIQFGRLNSLNSRIILSYRITHTKNIDVAMNILITDGKIITIVSHKSC